MSVIINLFSRLFDARCTQDEGFFVVDSSDLEWCDSKECRDPDYFKNYYLPVRKLNYVSLRLANVYGPRQDPYGEAGVIAIFISNLLNNKQSYINGTGKQTRDFIYVDDVVNACIKSISKGKGIYNIGTSKEISISKLYSNISKLINEKKVKYKKAIPGEVIRSVLKCQKAKRELNWKSQVTLEQGIKKTINYFK